VAVSKFRAVIFDIGRVLIRVDISRAMAGLASGLPLTPARSFGPRSRKIPIGWIGKKDGFLLTTGTST